MQGQGLAKSRSHAHVRCLGFAVVINMGLIDHFGVPID